MFKIESFGIVPFARAKDEQWLVLLILHAKGSHWGFPKGKPNPGETPLESACRELKEETGLEATQVLSKEAIAEHYHFMRRHQRIFKSVHYFPAVVKGALKLQTEEIRSAKWLPLEEAKHHLTFQEARLILERCQSFLC